MAKKGLGRGLDAIFRNDDTAASERIRGKRETEKSSDKEKKTEESGSVKASDKEDKEKEASEKETGKDASKGKKTGTAERKASSEKTAAKKKSSASGVSGKAEPEKSGEKASDRRFVRISLIEPNRDQPRKKFDEESLAELAGSIKRYGIIQPLIVKKTGFTYTIIAGERRWRAARLAGLKEVPVIIRDIEDQAAAEIALIENIQREDLGAVEEAMAYRELIDAYGLTQEEVAERVAKSRSAIANSLRLLQLPEEVLLLISEDKLSAGHARCLITIDDREELIALAREIADKGLSVREAEKKADAIKKRKAVPAETDTAHADDADDIARDRVFLDKLERELTGGLGTKVRIKPGKKDRGRIEIDYYSLEELNRISDLLR